MNCYVLLYNLGKHTGYLNKYHYLYITFGFIKFNISMHFNFFKKHLQLIILLLISQLASAQIYINEIDSDSPGIDTKEFVEIRTVAPFTSLNGYILVFFNGNAASSTANQSYMTINLSNLTSDANGIVTIGSAGVSPVPDYIMQDNVIQNGEDAVAIYQAAPSAFTVGTLATTTNLIDALAYDTSDPDALGLMALLGLTAQYNENENAAQATESVQRNSNGTYTTKLPTPGAMNDSSGIAFNGITIVANLANKTEGDTLVLKFTTQTPVLIPLTLSFSLNNTGGFTTADYTGTTSFTIPTGAAAATVTITLVDDVIDEGDEVLKIKFGAIPSGFKRLNDYIEIRVVDNDFKIDAWGPPTAPTYGIVTPTYPLGYYNNINGLSGVALRQALQNIIADSTIVRAHCYGDIFDILNEADHNPKNSNQVCLMYVETPRAKLDMQTSGSGSGKWNREHIWPQSRGGFANGTSDTADGINVYHLSGAFNLLDGHADAHHLRAEDAGENSSRNNRDYGQDYNGPVGNKGSWKGDVARALFYMAVRYNGIKIVKGNPDDTTKLTIGDLDSLLKWNILDAQDDFEMNRNNYIYTWQKNRNPFIDLPDLANYIYGDKQAETFYLSTGITALNISNSNYIFPNPTTNSFTIGGNDEVGVVEIFNLNGQLVFSEAFSTNQILTHRLSKGMYDAKIIIKNNCLHHKLKVE
jgi:Endonuclease I/Secretion system C-terminal sorting domain